MAPRLRVFNHQISTLVKIMPEQLLKSRFKKSLQNEIKFVLNVTKNCIKRIYGCWERKTCEASGDCLISIML